MANNPTPEPIKIAGTYDSTADTLFHKADVAKNMTLFASGLTLKAIVHDDSKLAEPEKSEFDRLTPLLKTLVYGSEEYQNSLLELKVALSHHYAHNSHHPEHYADGIKGMDLFDLVEMFCDWTAAVKRMSGGDIMKSIEINKKRFNMSDDLVSILKNTAIRHFGAKELPEVGSGSGVKVVTEAQ